MMRSFFLGLILFFASCLTCFAGTIAIFGDSQNYPRVQKDIVQAIVALKPDAVFRVGDNVDDGKDPQQWQEFKKINAPILKSIPYYSPFGNHEKGSPLFFDAFPTSKGRHWFSVDVDGVHFIILDSNLPLDPESKQYAWLKKDLSQAKNKYAFKVLLFHHPLFGVGSGHKDDEKHLRKSLLPLIERYGVSLVLTGHEHSYQRFNYKGVCMITTAGGGSHLIGQVRTSPYLVKYIKAHHYCVMTIHPKELTIKAIGLDGRVLDEVDIKK